MARDVKIRILGDAKSAKDAFATVDRDAGGFFDSVSTQAVAFGTALGDAITSGVSAAFDQLGEVVSGAFDMEDVAASMEASLGVSAERAGELGETAGSLYRDAWGSSMDEVGAAVETVASAFEGLGADDLETVTGQAIAFAEVFNTDVDSAIRSADQLVTQGLAPNAEAAMDLLTTGMQELPVSVRDELLEATNEYGQFFDQLGISGEEAIGGLVNAGEDGVYGIDKFGDALKELTIRSTDMSATSVAAYESAGLSAEDMSTRFLAGGETANGAFNDLIDGLLSIEDPVEQSNAAIALFGAPLEDLGVSEIPEFLEGLSDMDAGMEDVAGSADAMADAYGGTNRAKIEAFRRKVMGKLSEGVGFLIEKLEEVWPTIQNGFGKAVDWMQTNLLPIWQDFTEDVLPKVIDGLEDIGDAFAAAFRWMMDNKGVVLGALAGLAVAVGVVLVPAFLAWAAAAAAAAAATLIAAAPFVAIGVALAAVGAGIVYAYQNFEGFRTVVDGVARFFRDTVWPIMQTVFGKIVEGATGVVNWVKSNWDTISSIFKSVFNGIKFYVDNVVVPFWTTIINGALGVVNWFKKNWGKISGIVGTIIDGGAAVIRWFKDLPGNLAGAFGDGFKWLADKARDVRNYISERVQNIVDSVKNIATRTATGFADGFRWLRDRALAVREYIRDRVQNIVDSVKNIATRTATGFGDGFRWLRDRALAVREYIRGRVQNIVDSVKGIATRTATLFGDGFGWLRDRALAVREYIRDQVNTIVSFFSGMPARLVGLVGSMRSAGVSIGAAILGGIGAGIRGAVGFFGDIGAAVVSAIKVAANGLIDRLNNILEFTIPGPGFLPDIHLNPPDIPHLHSGGWVNPMGNDEMLAVLQRGEYVASRAELAGRPRSDSPFVGAGGPLIAIDKVMLGRDAQVIELRDELEKMTFGMRVANT